MGTIRVKDLKCLIKLVSDFKYTILIGISLNLNKIHSGCRGVKSNLNGCIIIPVVSLKLKSKKMSASGKRSGLCESTLDVFKCSGNTIVVNRYIRLQRLNLCAEYCSLTILGFNGGTYYKDGITLANDDASKIAHPR